MCNKSHIQQNQILVTRYSFKKLWAMGTVDKQRAGKLSIGSILKKNRYIHDTHFW